jgi:phosphatidylglycerophosphatase A
LQDSQPSTFIKRGISLIVTWFGCGRVPRAPGTIGTLGAIPIVWAFAQLNPIGYMVATFTLIVIAIFCSQIYLDLHPGLEDPGEIVIDEVVGFLVTMTWLPFTWQWLLLGFVLFRALDILKPPPISYVDEKIKGGIGVVADDVLAGIIASIILQVVYSKGWIN